MRSQNKVAGRLLKFVAGFLIGYSIVVVVLRSMQLLVEQGVCS